MNHKVLLADDSLTIQKVIKITLANQPYDITDCSNEDELFHKLPSVQPKIVFLDFNLSEKFTGYELCTKIKSLSPSTKILLLLGTFDTVDDAAMEKCGASDKIVKPFDSNKFIATCKKLVETFANEEDTAPAPVAAAPKPIEANPEDLWQMSHSTERIQTQEKAEVKEASPLNALNKEISDWGMSVPGVINESTDSGMELPPIIGGTKPVTQAALEHIRPEIKFPQNDDLDYPSIEESRPATPVATPAPKEDEAAGSKLISIDSFNNKPFELELEGSYVPDEANVESIEAQIRDEVEGDLWQVDDFEDIRKEVTHKIDEIKSDFTPSINDFDESLFSPLDEKDSSPSFTASLSNEAPQVSEQNIQELRSEMEAMVKKYVKEYMDQLFQKNVEKVSWEVIPDLAENLIRQELGKISHKILNDQN